MKDSPTPSATTSTLLFPSKQDSKHTVTAAAQRGGRGKEPNRISVATHLAPGPGTALSHLLDKQTMTIT